MKLPKRPLRSDRENEDGQCEETDAKKLPQPPLRQQRRARAPKPSRFIAYDYETSRIEAGTPRPLYITAYGENPPIHYASAIEDMAHLTRILVSQFLIDEFLGVKFVAWNGNNFDAYFNAAALIYEEGFVLRPYLTRSGSLRGLRVIRKEDVGNPKADGWEFLDGIAMLGLVGTNLDKFTANFAPKHRKLTGVIDFEKEEFDAKNPKHCEYAMQDSIGLYHGMIAAQFILMEVFDQPLTVTMGGACIKIFKAHIPRETVVYPLQPETLEIVRDYVMRGGFCYCNKRYHGPVWKYDINQAYAAAMREAQLPAGRALHTATGLHKYARVYIARVTATNPRNKIPFYFRSLDGLKLKSRFALHSIDETWLTSIEIEQLQKEGWKVNIQESYTWEDSFNMREYVDKLERIRTTCEGGPSGPIGTMMKATGNHSYGKTVEQLEPIEFVMSAEMPPGYLPYMGDGNEQLEHVWYRFVDDQRDKDYHQPHIGAFITAHVRMVLRRAALLAPDEWLYADTDCVVFSCDVTAKMDVDGKRYGAWKVEEAGTEYKIIAKKVYTQVGAEKNKRSAKGLNVKKLSDADFDHWHEGQPPVQQQVQRNNFMRVMRGADMYRNQVRKGTAVEANK